MDHSKPFPFLNILGALYTQLFAPVFNFAEGFKANQSNITIGYNEHMNLKVGPYNTSNGEMQEPDYFWFLTQETVAFSAEFPNGNPGGAWFVTFDPPLRVKTKNGGTLNSTATISLRPSTISTEPIQNCVIRIRFADSWSIQDLWRIEKQDKSNFSFIFRLTWPLAALVDGFGKWSGQTLTDYYTYDIVAKVKTHHQVTFQEVGLQQLQPNQITSLPVTVTNRGNYNDTFGFHVTTGNGTNLETTGNNTITLTPGAQGDTFIGISVPPNFLDTGTLQSLKIQAYSTEQPDTIIGEQTIPLVTQGLYVSEITGIGVLGAGVLILLVIILLFLLRKTLRGKYYKEPEKPWKIPEEQDHLAELKRTDKKAYNQERKMMADEYQSAMLWFDDYKKAFRQDRHKKKTKAPTTTSITKRLQNAFTLRIRKRPKKEKLVKVQQPKESRPLASHDDADRDKALQRILKEQKRQARFLKKS